VVQGHEVLVAVLDPLHGPAELPRQPRDQVVLGVELAARPEAAAHVALDQADRLLRDLEQRRQRAPVEVLDLRRAPDRDATGVAVVGGDERTRLQRHGAVALHAELLADDHVDVVEHRHVAVRDGHAVDHVRPHPLVQQRRALLHGLDRVEHDRQRVGLDVDRGRGVLGHVGVVGHHEGDRLADVAHAVAGERRLQRVLAALGREQADGDAHVGHVVGGEDAHHARHRLSDALVDRDDHAVRRLAAHDPHVELTGDVHVRAELAAAGQQAQVLLARDAGADVGHERAGSRTRPHVAITVSHVVTWPK
jgi:hypothetical protein